jgi:hypothetical protein
MKKILSLFGLLLSLNIFCQVSQYNCGNELFDAYGRQTFPGYDSLVNQNNQKIKDYIANNLNGGGGISTLSNPQYLIPVVVHVVHPNGEAVGTGTNISYAQIQSQIAALNAAFARDYATYNGQAHTPWAKISNIQFCLAQFDCLGQSNWANISEPGVMRYPIGPGYPDGQIYNTNNNPTDAQYLYNLTHLPNPARFDFTQVLNVWIVNSIDGVNPVATIGYGTFPVGNTMPVDGVVMRADCFGDNTTGNSFSLMTQLAEGKIFAHEVGHYLNLRHIFEGACSGMNAAGSTTDPCDLNGDFICDIAPSDTQNIGCVTVNTCNETYSTGTTADDLIESVHELRRRCLYEHIHARSSKQNGCHIKPLQAKSLDKSNACVNGRSWNGRLLPGCAYL